MPAIEESEDGAGGGETAAAAQAGSGGAAAPAAAAAARPPRATVASECRGYLYKQGGGSSLFGAKTWKKRWFVLEAGGVLNYYKDQSDWTSGGAPLKDALYRPRQCAVSADSGGEGSAFAPGQLGIVVQPRNAQGGPRRLLLRAENEEDRARWLAALGAKR